MVNKLYEKRSYTVIIAAVAVTLVVLLGGLISGLVCAVRSRNIEVDDGDEYARHVLLDAANGMTRSLSAMRLVNESEPAEELAKTALVFTVRAEAALECLHGEWSGDRAKEEFLNDLAVALHSQDALETAKDAQMLYDYAVKFAASIEDGSIFEYGGEIDGDDRGEPDEDPSPEQIEKAGEKVASALECETNYIGAWGGHLEFNLQRDGLGGYAVVHGDKIEQFSFERNGGDGETPLDEAGEIALESARACGYDGLTVRYCDKVGSSVAVIMCRDIDGALAVDDFASAVVFGGRTVAFSAGGCENTHEGAPKPKVEEREARKASGGAGEGTLVVRTVNGRERICYEYRFDLDDGPHYVYVCAENGKQMQVK